jgi:hypothetical protein
VSSVLCVSPSSPPFYFELRCYSSLGLVSWFRLLPPLCMISPPLPLRPNEPPTLFSVCCLLLLLPCHHHHHHQPTSKGSTVPLLQQPKPTTTSLIENPHTFFLTSLGPLALYAFTPSPLCKARSLVSPPKSKGRSGRDSRSLFPILPFPCTVALDVAPRSFRHHHVPGFGLDSVIFCVRVHSPAHFIVSLRFASRLFVCAYGPCI